MAAHTKCHGWTIPPCCTGCHHVEFVEQTRSAPAFTTLYEPRARYKMPPRWGKNHVAQCRCLFRPRRYSQAPRELGLSSAKLNFVCGSFSVARNDTTRSPLIDRVSKVDLGPRREFRGTTGISVELTLLQDVSLQFQLLWCVVARDIACCVLRVMLCFIAGSPVQRGPLAHTAPIALSAPAQTVLPV